MGEDQTKEDHVVLGQYGQRQSFSPLICKWLLFLPAFFSDLFLCVICTSKNVSWRSLRAFLACCCCITNYRRFNYGHGAQTFQAAICLC